VNGKTIDVVALIMAYKYYTRDFQAKESELNNIRDISTSKDAAHMLPRESEIFSELAPTRESRLEQFAQEIDTDRIAPAEAIRKL
jgi:hypothetical protein